MNLFSLQKMRSFDSFSPTRPSTHLTTPRCSQPYQGYSLPKLYYEGPKQHAMMTQQNPFDSTTTTTTTTTQSESLFLLLLLRSAADSASPVAHSPRLPLAIFSAAVIFGSLRKQAAEAHTRRNGRMAAACAPRRIALPPLSTLPSPLQLHCPTASSHATQHLQ
jgi:hypothetical protein